MNMKEALEEAIKAIDDKVGGFEHATYDAQLDMISRLTSTIYIQANRKGQ